MSYIICILDGRLHFIQVSISLRRYASCVGPKVCMHAKEILARERSNTMNWREFRMCNDEHKRY